MARRRIRFNDWPTPRIELADTPDPACTVCAGRGGFQVAAYGAEEPDDVYCGCFELGDVRVLLPVPVLVARLFGYRSGITPF